MRYLGFIVILLFSAITSASEVTIPNSFVAGEKAIANDVNENFSTLADAINDNDDRITTNANGVKDNTDALASKQNEITQECNAGTYLRKINQDGTVVCEIDNVATGNDGDMTAVTAGTGLTGGAESGEAILSVDTSVIQPKLSNGICSAGQYVASIADNGAVTCSAPPTSTGDITAVNTAAGSGLTGGIDSGEANLAIDTNVVQTKLSGADCTDDNYVKSIAADGTTVCSTPSTSTGDVTAVNTAAGSGLTGGIDSGEANLIVDTTVIQTRVTGTCTVGQAVTRINEDGTVTCGNAPTDIITENGLTQSVNDTTKAVTLSADQTYLQRRLNSACAEGSSLRDISEDGTPTCELDADTDTTYSAGAGISFTEETTINSTVGAAITIKPRITTIHQNNFLINEVAKVSMTTPGDGYILVTHSGYIILFDTPNQVEIGIGASTSEMDTSVRPGFLDTRSNDRYSLGYSVTYLYRVESAGTHNYYGLAQKNEIFNAGQADIRPQSLTALFIPIKY